MPLSRLQTVDRQSLEFLYSTKSLEPEFIELKEGVCYCFRLFYGLVHELVRGAWLGSVRRIKENRPLLGTTTDFSDFMFGSGRAPLEVYRPILYDLQNLCFYCGRRLTNKVEVDHFIPWSRYPVDLGHNFVLSHQNCNSQKGDFLAAKVHLQRWHQRNTEHSDKLAARFHEKNIIHDQAVSEQIAFWAYEQAERGNSEVWLLGKQLVGLSADWRGIFV